jgi:putative transposase
MILKLIDNAVAAGARLKAAAAIVGLSGRTIIRWRRQDGGCDRRKGPTSAPANKLNEQEELQILDIANSATFRDVSPKQIVPKLADQGVYIASESSFYRVLKKHQMLNHCQRSKLATHHRPKERMASGPCEVA